MARLRPEIERRFKRDPQVIELAGRMVEARSKLDELHRTIRIGGDPAVRKALEKLKALDAQYDQLWEVKHRQIREDLESGRGRRRPRQGAQRGHGQGRDR